MISQWKNVWSAFDVFYLNQFGPLTCAVTLLLCLIRIKKSRRSHSIRTIVDKNYHTHVSLIVTNASVNAIYLLQSGLFSQPSIYVSSYISSCFFFKFFEDFLKTLKIQQGQRACMVKFMTIYYNILNFRNNFACSHFINIKCEQIISNQRNKWKPSRDLR